MARDSIAPKTIDLEAEIAAANAPTVKPPANRSGTMKRVARRAEPDDLPEDPSEDELFAIWTSFLK